MLRRGRVVLISIALIGLALGAVRFEALALGGETLHPAGKLPFVPRTGDWEGVSRGFHVSFQLVRNPHNRVYGGAGYGVYDVTIATPSSCPISPGYFSLESEGTNRAQLVVSHGGSFPYRIGKKLGSFTGRSRAVVSSSYTVKEGGRKCSARLRWHLNPARRRAVADGRWTISFADGEMQHTIVSDGGRGASLGVPNVAPVCSGGSGGGGVGGIEVFIPANRHVDQTLHEGGGARLRLVLTFTGRRAGTGRFVASAPGCQPRTLRFTARRG